MRLEIWERNRDKPDRKVARIDSATVSRDRAEAPWTYALSDEGEQEGYDLPSYYFTAAIGEVTKRSSLLPCGADLVILVKYDNVNETPVRDEPYTLTLPTGEVRQGRTDGSGYVREQNLPPRNARIVFDRLPLEIGATLALVRPEGEDDYVPEAARGRDR